MMRISWEKAWGSATGPVTILTPQARIICGLLVFSVCMVTPTTSAAGLVLALALSVAWALFVRPPWALIRVILLFGALLFLPYFLLVPLIHGPGRDMDWLQAFAVTWRVVFRGMGGMLASVLTVAALSQADLREGLLRLPIPRLVSGILIQIVQQTGNLLQESSRIVEALRVRGAANGPRAGLRVVTSLPGVWLPRIVDRAERVGDAMELRGYCEQDLAVFRGRKASLKDAVAMGLAAAALVAAVLLRIQGGA